MFCNIKIQNWCCYTSTPYFPIPHPFIYLLRVFMYKCICWFQSIFVTVSGKPLIFSSYFPFFLFCCCCIFLFHTNSSLCFVQERMSSNIFHILVIIFNICNVERRIENTWNSLTQSMGKYWHRGMTGLDNTSSYVVSLLFDMMCVFPVIFFVVFEGELKLKKMNVIY